MSPVGNENRSVVRLRFWILILATWVGFGTWHVWGNLADLGLVMLFAGAATALSIWVLHLLDYFGRMELLPRRSDLLTIGVSLPVCGAILYGAMVAIFRHFPIPLADIWICLPLAAMAVFGTQYLMEWRMLLLGHRRRVVLELLPHERESFINQCRDLGLDRFIEFLTPTDLKEAFLTGKEARIDKIIISRGAVRVFNDAVHLVRAHLAGIPIVDRRELSTHLSGRIRLTDADSWSYILTATQQTQALRLYAHTKVLIEPILALILAIVLSPLLILTAIVIRWTSAGPAIYTQDRTGYMGRTFRLFKFRSMRQEAEARGHQWASEGDSRVTRVGKFIRATRIDELPQLWNVIRGEMSFCGPRPERPEFYRELAREIPLFSMRTVIRPGITGWAQVCAGYAASVEESRTKLEYDLYYIKHLSPRLDTIILIRTMTVAFMGSERAKALTYPRAVRRPAFVLNAGRAQDQGEEEIGVNGIDVSEECHRNSVTEQ